MTTNLSESDQLEGYYDNPENLRKYPLLYETKGSGKTRVWACWVVANVLYRTDGFIPGKIKEPSPLIVEGNTLRTAEEQAESECEKKWIAQVSKGYAPAATDRTGIAVYNRVRAQQSANGGMNRGVKMHGETEITPDTTSGVKDMAAVHHPMLAKKYKDDEGLVLSSSGTAIVFPAIVQAKVDGVRALPRLAGDSVILESRNGKDYVHLAHIREAIKALLTVAGAQDLILDGEMYVHELYRDKKGVLSKSPVAGSTELKGVERFQFLSEACKITRSKAHTQESLVEFWIFDLWDPTATNTARNQRLLELFKHVPKGSPLKLVPTVIVHNHAEIEATMERMVGETSGRNGYEFEGIMIRQAGDKYVSRSGYHCDSLLKYKRFEDEEWAVIGAEPCAGTHAGAVKWICTKDGKQVIAKQMGSVEDSKRMYAAFVADPAKYNGKLLNIRFNERTKDGVPRFPRATAFREDINR